MKLLMHACCAPCSVYPVETLRKEGIEPIIYWFNPNIHPYMEYKSRRDSLKEYVKSMNLSAIFDEDYGLDEFCIQAVKDLKKRCTNYCYPVRIQKLCKYAKDNGYDAVTTTLLYSIYQNHDFIKKYMEETCNKYGLQFVYRDFREGFWQGHDKAKEIGLYMQKYCGCIFSEEMSKSAHQKKDKEESARANRDTERRIRLDRLFKNLELKVYKNGKQGEIKFIYNLKKEVYKKYVEEIYGEWNEENQQKLFARFMKENLKNIELIYLEDELVGFYNGKAKDNNIFEIGNICVKPEYQNKGIELAVLKEILFEHKEQNIKLQVFKTNEKAIKLYEKIRFEKVDETETHYIMETEN